MTTTREKALEAALRQMLRADEAQMNGETFPFSDAILQARAALALPPDQPAAPAPVAAGEHTPGPWRHNDVWGLIMHGKTEICALHSGKKADARLIAAAPDMLAALQNLIRPLKNGWKVSDMAERIADAESAIARATGREG